MLLIGVGKAPWNVLWAVFAGASAFAIVYYTRTALNLLGQRYEDVRGASFPVAAATAKLAESMFLKKDSEGLSVLYQSLRISEVAFSNRGHRPVKFYDIMATVEGLREVDPKDVPFESLEKLAKALSRLPRRDELPKQFEDFLTEMKWPGGFEIVQPEKGPSIYDHLTLLTSVIVAAGIVLELVLPGYVRDALYLGLSSLVGEETGNFLGLTMLLIGVINCLRPLAFRASHVVGTSSGSRSLTVIWLGRSSSFSTLGRCHLIRFGSSDTTGPASDPALPGIGSFAGGRILLDASGATIWR